MSRYVVGVDEKAHVRFNDGKDLCEVPKVEPEEAAPQDRARCEKCETLKDILLALHRRGGSFEGTADDLARAVERDRAERN